MTRRVHYFIFLFILQTVAALFLSACGVPNSFKSRYKPVTQTKNWYGYVPADHGAVSVEDFGYNDNGAADASYEDFDITQTSTKAVYTAAVYDSSSTAKMISYQYEAYGNSGNGGWSTDASKSGVITSTAAVWSDASVIMDYLGNYLSVFWDSAASDGGATPAAAAAAPSSVLRTMNGTAFGSTVTATPLLLALQKPSDDSTVTVPLNILPRTKSVFFDRYYALYPPNVTTYTPTAYAFYSITTHPTDYIHSLKYATYSIVDGWGAANAINGVANIASTINLTTFANPEIKGVGDGLGVTFLWIDDVTTRGKIYSRWLVDGALSPANTAEPDVVSDPSSTTAPIGLDADSDGEGNVLAVFYQHKSTLVSANCTEYYAINCDIRLYANMRNSSGQWVSGPTQVDTSTTFGVETKTTHYQPATFHNPVTAYTGGVDYARPTVVYVGHKRFIAAFAMNNATTTTARTSSLYVRGYTVGKGWDSEPTILDSDTVVNGAVAADYNAYRIANTISLSSDRNGNALLVAQVVTPSATRNVDYETREFSYKAYRLTGVTDTSNGSWSTGDSTPFDLLPPCSADYLTYKRCQNLTAKSAVFADGESVVVVPAPADVGAEDQIRLYNFIYR